MNSPGWGEWRMVISDNPHNQRKRHAVLEFEDEPPVFDSYAAFL
jgi:hypothetical protein